MRGRTRHPELVIKTARHVPGVIFWNREGDPTVKVSKTSVTSSILSRADCS